MVIYNINTNGPSTELVIEVINDTVYVEAHSVAYISGNISMTAVPHGFKDRFTAFFIGKKLYKPCYKGTGKIYMRPTIGSYHKFNVKEDQPLLLGKNAFIACRETITIEPKLAIGLFKFLSGTPMVNLMVRGNGNVVIRMPGAVQEVKLNNDKFVAYESDIAAYSDSIKVSREPAGKGWLKIANKMVKVYRGTGSVFFTPHPNKDAK